MRPVRPSDVSKVVNLHRSVYSAEYLRQTIFYSPYVARYLKALISYPDLQHDHQLVGVWKGRKLIAYAHYRILERSFHLNQLVVHPSYQGKGIGRWLVEEWERRAKDLGQTVLSLDVSENNTRAYNWYFKMGFAVASKRYLYEQKVVSNDSVEEVENVQLLDWENTLAWYKTFAIANIRLKYESNVWETGWIHKALFMKVNTPEILRPILLRLARQPIWLFLICSGPLQGPLGRWRLANIVVRMEKPL